MLSLGDVLSVRVRDQRSETDTKQRSSKALFRAKHRESNRLVGAASYREGDPSLPYKLTFIEQKGHVVEPGHTQVANEIATHRESCTVMLGHTRVAS